MKEMCVHSWQRITEALLYVIVCMNAYFLLCEGAWKLKTVRKDKRLSCSYLIRLSPCLTATTGFYHQLVSCTVITVLSHPPLLWESLLIVIIWIYFSLLAAYPSACPAPVARTVPPSGRCLSGWSPSRWVSTVRTSPALGSSLWTRSCRWRTSKWDTSSDVVTPHNKFGSFYFAR